MANWNEPRGDRTDFGTTPGSYGEVADNTVMDQGLRKHMLSIYNYMASGVLLTGIVALAAVATGVTQAIFGTGLWFVVALSPLAFVLFMSFGANKFSAGALQVMFWSFATVMGVSMSTIFLQFSADSIAVTFFATAGAFAGLSLWGYTTKKDLSGFGSFLIMGVVGLIIASLLNAFLIGSPGLELAIAAIGVLIFAGLTAYDTQRLKAEYFHFRGTEWAQKSIILGALSLYLDFINMFMFLLRFLGSRE
ncbi:Bax inhibitor-1/YccA family protein [Pontixanthobacter aestiaquae]|uniref:BAX inhibitor (BI)-1/YccA family protein n=1 Tax=Pontixanthobacter aestiaquae TaxID=1509367 RepID=A0A844ZAX7_9SPHN|nr:Bax inhibitor-1/YccA family protein [Pontixanthobacter aestiaquae]MDN3646008.1 Bax inhibitor-1/YccA family protein [Pontixanthobacter aestiaquae]MXO82999.1 BAX inhibitor (BI)-1/YccA family protein [Pontixanthobacter aestiaquae]